MTDGEILKSYREAKNQTAQVGVLAEMNLVSVDAMAAKLKELGLPVELPKKRSRGPGRPISFDAARALELYEEGQTDRSVAAQLGVRVECFADWRRRQGLKPHRPPRKLPVRTPEPPKPPKARQTRTWDIPAAPDIMTVAYMAEIFAMIAKWHPHAVVRLNGSSAVRISLVAEYGPHGIQPAMEICQDHR